MTPLLYIVLCLAGGVGAAVRLYVDGLLRAIPSGRFPAATALINLTGSLLLGLITGLTLSHTVPEAWRLSLGSGFLGGYTTFSTASLETFRLVQEGRTAAGLVNGVGVLITAVAAATVGSLIGVHL